MTRKRILLVGPPFSGHLHPLLGLARELADECDVTVVTTPGGARVATTCGLRSHAILADHEATVWSISDPGRPVRNHPILLYRQLRANVGLMGVLQRELDSLYRAEQPDLVIADFTVPVAGLTARRQGIRWWSTLPSPCVYETPDGPPAYFGGLTPARTTAGRLTHDVLRQATRGFKRLMWLRFQRAFRAMGLPAIYRPDGTEAVYSPERILALGVEALEFPRTYPPEFTWIGPVLFTPPGPSPSPVFDPHARAHVLISLGTHLDHAKHALVPTLRQVAERHPDIMLHFSHGRATGAAPRLEGNFHEYDFISYADHLPRYDLVVHHAGTGIMNHCLRLGTPAVVLPQDFDQFDYAARLCAAGVALPGGNSVDLERAILRALDDPTLRKACLRLREAAVGYRPGEQLRHLVREIP